MPQLTDAQLVDALTENGHDDLAEALEAKVADAPDDDEEDRPAEGPEGLGGPLRRAAGGVT